MAKDVVSIAQKRLSKEILEDDKFKWSYFEHKDVEFWCQHLGKHVFLTPDMTPNGTYYVRDVSEKGDRVFPVIASQLVLATDKRAKTPALTSDGLPINSCNYEQLRSFFQVNFIPSYSWKPTDELSASQVKSKWESNINSSASNQNLVRQILDLRKAGVFVSKEDFLNKTKELKLDFPFDVLAEFLDFKV